VYSTLQDGRAAGDEVYFCAGPHDEGVIRKPLSPPPPPPLGRERCDQDGTVASAAAAARTINV